MCLASIKHFIVRTVSNLYNIYNNNYNNNCLFDIILCLQPFCKRQHLFVRSVQWRSSNHHCFLYTQRVFTHDWLNSYYWLSALCCLYKCPRKQCDEHFWSRTFVFSSSRELYLDFIVACVLCTDCLLSIPFSLTLLLLVYLCNKLAVVVGIAFICRFQC